MDSYQMTDISTVIGNISKNRVKSKKVSEKGTIYYVKHQIQTPFLDLEFWQFTIPKPVEVGKSYIPQKFYKLYKLLFEKEFWNWKSFYQERLQMNSSKSGASQGGVANFRVMPFLISFLILKALY